MDKEFLMPERELDPNADKVAVLVAWPYANGPRHLGHGASLVPGDVLARYYRSIGSDVLMVSGTDEHGTPNAIAAETVGSDPEDYVREINEIIRNDFIDLGMSFDWFTRTHTQEHTKNAQEFFASLVENGFIEKGVMLGAFDEITSQSLPDRYVEGACPNCGSHSRGDQCEECTMMLDPSDLLEPTSKITGNPVEFKDTEHYFLLLDKLAPKVEEWLEQNQNLRSNAKAVSEEMARTLRPRAITRDMNWGVPLPEGYELEGEGEKVLYVWFEAVIGYVSASMQWAKGQGKPAMWKEWWNNNEAQHSYAMGKDNVPFHTIVWPAIISAARESGYDNLHLPDKIASTEYLTFNDEKFSSSRENVVYVSDLISLVGPDALRYYLLSAGPETSDVEFSFEQLTRRVNDELIAKWGNLVSRTQSIVAKNHDGKVPDIRYADLAEADRELLEKIENGFEVIGESLQSLKFSQGLKSFMALTSLVNKYLYDAEPWKTVKEDRHAADVSVYVTLTAIQNLSVMVAPFLPHSSQKVHELIGQTGELTSQPYNLHYVGNGDDIYVLTGDYRSNKSRWHFTYPKSDTQISPPIGHLFNKINQDELVQGFKEITLKRQLGNKAIKSIIETD